MLSVLHMLTLVALSLPLVSARPTSQPEPRAIPPNLDPFYKPPTGFEFKQPGAILRQRNIVTSFFGLIPDPIEAYQLLYRTTAIDGSPIATVTTVFKPLHAKKDRFLSFHTAYDSTPAICNPSYTYQFGALQTNIITSLEQLVMQAYLLSGYIVSSPDYEGPDGAYAAGPLEGMGVLDSMRAVVNFRDELGLSDSPMVVGSGYAGGAIATGWAAGLHPTYASELNIKGWVAGGTPANLTGMLLEVDGTILSGALPGAIDGLLKPSAYGAQLQPLFDSIVTAEGRKILDSANKNCFVENLIAYSQKSILSTEFQSLGPGVLSNPTVAAVLDKNIMGSHKNETPTAPVLIYHAAEDEGPPYANASSLSDRWCGYGASVEFLTVEAGGHLTTEVLGLPDAIKFTADAFNGKLASGCSKTITYADELNPIALGAQLEPVLVLLAQALVDLGKMDANIKKDVNNLRIGI